MIWADKLIREYEIGRNGLSKMKEVLGDSDFDKLDKSQINSMIGSMNFSIDWLKSGREPEKYRGIDKKAAYQRNSLTDMDLFPSLDVFPKEKELDNEEKEAILKVLLDLSPRERQCFILHKVYLMSFYQVSQELKIGRSTVQKYVERAKEKISCRADVVQVS